MKNRGGFMKLIDKLKNALFEEEYVEVEEKPKRKPAKKEIKPEEFGHGKTRNYARYVLWF